MTTSPETTERILDAAGRLFARDGVGRTGMDAVARAAGCSRATLYRCFDNRRALHLAFAHREARRIVAEVAGEVAHLHGSERYVEAILSTVDRIRSAPELAAWLAPGDSALLADLVNESPVIEALAAAFTGHMDADLGRWMLRVVVSFVALPGRDRAEERRLLQAYVAPLLAARTR